MSFRSFPYISIRKMLQHSVSSVSPIFKTRSKTLKIESGFTYLTKNQLNSSLWMHEHRRYLHHLPRQFLKDLTNCKFEVTFDYIHGPRCFGKHTDEIRYIVFPVLLTLCFYSNWSIFATFDSNIIVPAS